MSGDTIPARRALRNLLLATLVVFGIGAAISFLAIDYSAIPYNIRELFDDHPIAASLLLAFGPILAGAVLVGLGRFWYTRPYVFAGLLPFIGVLLGSILFVFINLALPRESIEDVVGTPVLNVDRQLETWFRFIGLFVGPMVLTTLGIRGSLGRLTLSTLPGVLSVGALSCFSFLIVVVYAGTDNLVELMRGEGNALSAIGSLLFFVVAGLTLGWTAQSLFAAAVRKWLVTVLGLLLLLASIPAAWLALLLATNPKLEKYDAIFSAVQFLFSSNRQNYLGHDEVFWRFAISYAGLMFVTAIGGAISLALIRIGQDHWNRHVGIAMSSASSLRHTESRRDGTAFRSDLDIQPSASNPSAGDVEFPIARTPSESVTGRYYAFFAAATAAIVVYGSLVPFKFVPLSLGEAAAQFGHMLQGPWVGSDSRVDWSVNFLVTVPLGFCGMGVFLAGVSSFNRVVLATLLVLTAGLALSVAVEFAQLWFANRVSSIHDIVAQGLGTLFGIGIWLLAGKRFTQWLDKYATSYASRDALAWLLDAYVLALVLWSLLPLDVITSLGELSKKYRAGKFELIPFSYQHASIWDAGYTYATQFAIFIPVGIWASIAFRRQGARHRYLLECIALGVLVVLAIEAAQALIVTRYTSSTDVLLGSLGVVMGVVAAKYWRKTGDGERSTEPTPSQWPVVWLVAALLYAALLPAIFWAPYDLTGDAEFIRQRLEVFWSMPFARMQSGSDLQAIFAIIRKAVWFMPLGSLIALGVRRMPFGPEVQRWCHLLGVGVIAAVALGVELGQILLPGKFADATDALIYLAGGTAALWFTSRMLRQKPCQ